jgi:hypothetical protein
VISQRTAIAAAAPRRPAPAGGAVDRTPLTDSGRVPPPQVGAGGFDGDIVDEWGLQSFPASDPPANW